jgi:hypothetical protein
MNCVNIPRDFLRKDYIPEVALISGHKDVRQLFRYTHLKAEDVVKKLQIIEEILYLICITKTYIYKSEPSPK